MSHYKSQQEILDIVCIHLLSQMKKSVGMHPREPKRGMVCMYRGDNGLKCAIGCLIPDAWYSPDLEGGSIHSISVRKALGPELTVDISLLDELQLIHDDFEPERWATRLSELAQSRGLKMTQLTKPSAKVVELFATVEEAINYGL